MQPVPETEKMEEFRDSPRLNLRIEDSSYHLHPRLDEYVEKPFTPLKTTELTIPASNSHSLYSTIPPLLTPQSRGHLRSRSSNGLSTPPAMLRAQSLPGFNSTNNYLLSPQRSASPRRVSASRLRSPRKPVDEVFIGLPNRSVRIYPGNPETPMKDREVSEYFDGCCSQNFSENGSSTRSHQSTSHRSIPPKTLNNLTSSPNSSFTSFVMHSSRPNDMSPHSNFSYSGSLSYPGSFSSISIPSTPTSARSRSSSISSLETIPDSPDAEEAALEADRKLSLKATADEIKAKNIRDIAGGRGRLLGSGFARDKRMRWSVCGAERRGDLNLDTIWED